MAKRQTINKSSYVLKHGSICPYCYSNDIEQIGGYKSSDFDIRANIRCNVCIETWIDIYTLTDVV